MSLDLLCMFSLSSCVCCHLHFDSLADCIFQTINAVLDVVRDVIVFLPTSTCSLGIMERRMSGSQWTTARLRKAVVNLEMVVVNMACLC